MPNLISTTGRKKLEYLKSQEGVFLPLTLSSGVVSADSDGNKLVIPGTVLGKITASGSGYDTNKYGPFDSGASDGRETAVCLLDTYANLKDGDLEVGGLFEGHVVTARVTSDGVLGTVSDAVKSALRSVTSDIHFH